MTADCKYIDKNRPCHRVPVPDTDYCPLHAALLPVLEAQRNSREKAKRERIAGEKAKKRGYIQRP